MKPLRKYIEFIHTQKRSSMKKIKKIIYDFFILIIPVMIGVFLGLLANNWNNDQINKEETQKLLKSLTRELDSNDETIKESLSYFIQLRDSIYHLSDKNRSPSSFSFWKGLNPPLLKSASFKSAILSGRLSNLDFETVEELSSTYDFVDDLKQQSETYILSMINKIGSPDFGNGGYLILLENYSHDQIASLKLLKEQLQKAKEKIDHNLKNE